MWRGNFAGRDQDCVETAITDRLIGICSEPDFGCCGNSAALPLMDRLGGILEADTRFYFHEDQKMAPARDDVDLAEGASPATRQNSEPLGDQKGGGAAFSRNSTRNAACRSGRTARLGRESGPSLAVIHRILREDQCTLVDLATRSSGGKRNFADCILDRNTFQCLAQ